jgi:tetratricopeptide (TPR) repeat protein
MAFSLCLYALARGQDDDDSFDSLPPIPSEALMILNEADSCQKAESYKQAINLYREFLEFISPQTRRGIYVAVKSMIGHCFLALGIRDGNVEYHELALKNFQECLQFASKEEQYDMYCSALISTGAQYLILSDFKQRIMNLRKAADAYEEYLSAAADSFLIGQERTRLYMIGCLDLASIYARLSYFSKDMKYSDKAADRIAEVRDLFGPEEDPYFYALARQALADYYIKQASWIDAQANLGKALGELQEALKIFTDSTYILEYAWCQFQMGDVYVAK